MSGPANQFPGPVIAPDALFADFSVISSPLALANANDAHTVICAPVGTVIVQLNNDNPTDGETYKISNLGGSGTPIVLIKRGLISATLVSLADDQAAWLQYDSAAGEYLLWGKFALV